MSLECSNEGFNLYLGISSESPSMLNDIGGRNRISMIRNLIIRRFLSSEHEYVFWLDADITRLPPDTIRRLHDANPGGVSAPAVVLESSNTSDYHMLYCHKPACGPGGGFRFYDTAAFFEVGKTVQLANKRERGHAQFGSVSIWPPYAGSDSMNTVEMESVGTVYLTPAEVNAWLVEVRADLNSCPCPLLGLPVRIVPSRRSFRALFHLFHRTFPDCARCPTLLRVPGSFRARRHCRTCRAH